MMGWWWRLVRFGFRLLYNELAFTYDLVSTIVSLGAWRCWQRAALKHLPATGRLLELAHGTGNLQLDLWANGFRPVGYDLSPYMGRIARRKLHRDNRAALLAQGRAQSLPFASGAFAAVVSTFPTNFIIDPRTLDEVYRVLEPDGLFVIVPNGILTGGGLVEHGLEWLYRVTGQREQPQFDFEGLFAAHGFSAVVVQERCPRSLAQVIVARKKVW